MDEEVVNKFLKSCRKARKQATCYPCQRRKVKCDRGSPCKVCVARGHSFLCSYVRQPEGLSTAPLEILTNTESPGTNSGETLSMETSDISILRKELDKLRHEVHQARARHRRCQATHLVARHLRARCKDFEVNYASLRAGNWTALARLDRMMDKDPDVDDESITCYHSPDDSEPAMATSSRKHDEPLHDATFFNHQQLFMAQSCTSQQGNGGAYTQAGSHSPLTTSTSPPNMALGMQNLQLSQKLSIDMPTKPQALPSSLDLEVAKSFQETQNLTNASLHSLEPGAMDCRMGRSVNTNSISTQRQSTALLQLAGNCHAVDATYPSTPAPIGSKHTAQVPTLSSGAQLPPNVEDSEGVHGLLVPPSMTIFPDTFWVHNGSYPPMAFTQYTDLMERSYADYCSRILVNTQE